MPKLRTATAFPVLLSALSLAAPQLLTAQPTPPSALASAPSSSASAPSAVGSESRSVWLLPYENPMSVTAALLSNAAPAAPERFRDRPLTDSELLGRISSLYKLQVNAIDAQIDGRYLDAETHIMEAIGMIEQIMQDDPEIQSNRRFTEVYRSVMAEYREFYGIPASEGQVQGEVFEIMDELLAEDDILPVEDFKLSADILNAKTEVPLIQNTHVTRQLIYYTMRRPEVMERWLSRSKTYFPMMERIFREEKVPVELIHLSMIESGLVPTARSRAAATGMWQFMQATGAMYGLEVNWWVDERRDPEKATRAAARHLRDLYGIWGDWHLALANYNISPRGLNRAIRSAGGKKDYWAAFPYLPRETRGYVPGYIAATMIALNPDEFGFQEIQDGPAYQYDVAEVAPLMSLEALASAAGVSTEELKELNPELLRWATPPGGNYPLKIPYGTRPSFLTAYEALPKDERRTDIAVHVVRSGENLGLIARKYGTTVRALYETNDQLKTTIYPGQQIFVPVAPGPAESIAVNMPSNQAATSSASTGTSGARASTTSRSTTTRSSASSAAAPAGTVRMTYKVKPNDTIGHIAEWFDVGAWQIRAWNNVGDNIRAGQSLTIHVPNAKRGYYSKVDGWSYSEKQELERRQRSGENIFADHVADASENGDDTLTYTVRQRDTLTEIARTFGVTVSSIQQTNNLRGTTIYPGQKLTIRR